MKKSPENPPFEGNLIRERDYGPCGCQDNPHWVLEQDAEGTMHAKACPGRYPVEEFRTEEQELLGYRILKGRK